MQEKAQAITSHPEWNQTKLAEMVGSAQSTVQRWVTGESEPSGESRDEINRIYDELFPKNAPNLMNDTQSSSPNPTSTNTLLLIIQRVDEVIEKNNLELTYDERWEVINNELDRINSLRPPLPKI